MQRSGYLWICRFLFISVLFLLLYNSDHHSRFYFSSSSTSPIDTPITTSTENTKKNLILQQMSNDSDAHICYTFKSLSMPDDFIDLDAIAPNRPLLHLSRMPSHITFDQVHEILYGDPKSKSIYSNAGKVFEKKFDSSYPHTSMSVNLFHTIIKKLDSRLTLQFVIEVGSFTGNSASVMGTILKNEYPDAFLFCIDTWLGGT